MVMYNPHDTRGHAGSLESEREDGALSASPAVSDTPPHNPSRPEASPLGRVQSEAQAAAVLASVLDPTLTIDPRGTVLAASQSVEKVFGYRPEELIGRNISILMPEPHRSKHDGYLENYRRTGITHILGRTREFEVVRKDGRHIDCELSVARADIEGQSEPLFTGSFRDVTERKRTQRALFESERRFRAIFDQEFQLVGLLNRDGTVLEMNRTALKAIGASEGDVRGLPFWQTAWWQHSPVDQDRVRQAILDAAQGEFVRFEVELTLDDGSTRSIDFSLKPILGEDGRVQRLLPEGRDVTELKRAQRAETAMLRTLAAIGEGAATMAHEIKNPITAINIALRAVASELGEDDRVVLEDLASRMKRLEALMRQTLSFATPLVVDRTTCDARSILENARLLLRESLAEAGTRVTVDVDPDGLTLEGAQSHLEDVIVNLLGNALEALEEGGEIRLSARCSSPSEICLSVEDDGPFVTTKPQGTGLGLAISQKVVDAHEGRLEIGESTLGGARFSIYIPD